MNKTRLWELLAKKQYGEASPEEQLELNNQMDTNVATEQLVREVLSAEAALSFEDRVFSATVLEERWQAFATASEFKEPLKGGRVAWLIKLVVPLAAACLLLIWGYQYYLQASKVSDLSSQERQAANIISTAKGVKKRIVLPDGSKVWLNVDSKISFSNDFGEKERKVELEGEAFFDVHHDAHKPFLIHTDRMDVRVLGTAFDIKVYRLDKVSEASVIRGSIEVQLPNDPDNKLTLKKDEKVSIEGGSFSKNVTKEQNRKTQHKTVVPPEIAQIAISKLSKLSLIDTTIVETSWMQNKLLFKSKNFYEVSKDFERWFDVKMNILDSGIMKKKFTGSIVHENISEALTLLQSSYYFKFRLDRDSSVVYIY